MRSFRLPISANRSGDVDGGTIGLHRSVMLAPVTNAGTWLQVAALDLQRHVPGAGLDPTVRRPSVSEAANIHNLVVRMHARR
jgi:hypothetical protein